MSTSTVNTELSLGTQSAIAIIVRVAFGVAITLAIYAVLSTFIWAWLAAVIALIASIPLENCAPAQTAKLATYDAAVRSAVLVRGWFA